MVQPDLGFSTTTAGGYSAHECISAIQKCIRRSDEELALFFCLELSDANFYWMIKRLRVISYEDIGIGDMQAVMFANSALDHAIEWWKKKNDAWFLCLSNAVLALARAKKSRIADNFLGAINARRHVMFDKPDIPDVALDKHTHRGKKMGRGMDHFLGEGVVLDPPDCVSRSSEYEDEARKYWNYRESQKHDDPSRGDPGLP